MAKHGKRYRKAIAEYDKTKSYTISEAVAILKKIASAKFNESVEIHVNMGIDPRQADQQVRGTVGLPHGTGKSVRVAVFAKGDKAEEAKAAGAEVVGAEDLATRIQGGFLDFDACIATPDMMREVGKIGKILGPRGMMPNPKTGTVTKDIAQAIAEIKAGKVEFRLDRAANVHVNIGKIQFTEEQIADNCKTLLDALYKARPAAAKGAFIKSITLTSTMGPAIKINYSGTTEKKEE